METCRSKRYVRPFDLSVRLGQVLRRRFVFPYLRRANIRRTDVLIHRADQLAAVLPNGSSKIPSGRGYHRYYTVLYRTRGPNDRVRSNSTAIIITSIIHVLRRVFVLSLVLRVRVEKKKSKIFSSSERIGERTTNTNRYTLLIKPRSCGVPRRLK